ncbi:MAG: pyrroline-5-carboxylate reductase, partial [Chloroflexota bacterium]
MKYLKNKNIAVIGTGNMAGAMIGALLRNKETNPEQITASDPNPGQR